MSAVDWVNEAPALATHYVISAEPRIPSGWYQADGVKMRNLAAEGDYTFRLDDVHSGRALALVPRPVAWTGQGLPPVGTVCEFSPHEGKWEKVTVFARKPNVNGSDSALFDRAHCWSACAYPGSFRPLRTPDQIASEVRIAAAQEWLKGIEREYGVEVADQCENVLLEAEQRRSMPEVARLAQDAREHAIEQMEELVGDIEKVPTWRDALATLYDAGCRMPEGGAQ